MQFRHLMIDASVYQRIFVVGDIHGKLPLLKDMLAQVSFCSEQDILVSVGDLIDRGPDSAGMLEFYDKHAWFYAVAGNHEVLMADAMRHGGVINHDSNPSKALKLWFKNGGDWSLKESENRLKILERIIVAMPCAITIRLKSGKKVGISHAQPHTENWQEMQEWQGCLYEKPRWIWGRTRIKEDPANPILGVDYTLHGHTATEGLYKVSNSYFIDTASTDEYQGHLTFFELNSETEFQSIRQAQLI